MFFSHHDFTFTDWTLPWGSSVSRRLLTAPMFPSSRHSLRCLDSPEAAPLIQTLCSLFPHMELSTESLRTYLLMVLEFDHYNSHVTSIPIKITFYLNNTHNLHWAWLAWFTTPGHSVLLKHNQSYFQINPCQSRRTRALVQVSPRLGVAYRYQKACKSESILSSSCSLLSHPDAGFHFYSPFMQGAVICEFPLAKEPLHFTQFWASVALLFHIPLQKTESIHLHIRMKQRQWTGSSARLLISTPPFPRDMLHPSRLNLPNKCPQMETICSSIWDCKGNFH